MPDDPIIPEPLSMRLSIDANRATPALARMVADLLTQAGASVTFSDPRRIPWSHGTPNLTGLKVHIDRLTYVRNEEVARWGQPSNCPSLL